MDSSINNNNNNNNINSSRMHTSIGAIDGFFPTSPHFFDPNFLDTPSFPTSTATSSWAQPTPDPTNNLNYPNPTTTTTKQSTLAPGPTGRTSKKRSRASRRAPTTVLTTDTSNFRAMVQEFTGIPSPPFTSSTSLRFPRSLTSPPSSFLLRPFHHDFQPPSTSTSPSPLPPINMPQQQQQALAAAAAAAAASSSSSSGELRLPGVIGSGGDQTRRQQKQQDAIASCRMNFPGSMSSVAAATATEFHSEKGTEGLMDSWICSSD